MLLSTNISTLMQHYSAPQIVDMASEAGFDALDFSFFDLKLCNGDTDSASFKQQMLDLRAYAEQKGIVFNQAHAPFPSVVLDPQKSREVFGHITRSMRNASYLGVPMIVVHPVQVNFLPDGADLFEENIKFYSSLIPYCEEYGIKVGLENMWRRTQTLSGRKSSKINHCTCSHPEEFVRYVDALDDRYFVANLDIGHAMLVCEDPASFIRALGGKRLKGLHVQDVDGIADSHTLPFHGIVDWYGVMEALKEIGYEGALTYESLGFIADLPPELYPAAMRYAASIGKHLIAKFDEFGK